MLILLLTHRLDMEPGKRIFKIINCFEILYFQKLHRTAVCQVGVVHDDGEGGAEVPHGVHRREGRPAHSVHLCPR